MVSSTNHFSPLDTLRPLIGRSDFFCPHPEPPANKARIRYNKIMIARLSGTIIAQQFQTVIVDVGGVGYEVVLSRQAADKFRQGAKAEIFIAESIREDSYTLYGFVDADQRALYYQLNSVSGVGPKAAMSIISDHSTREIETAIAAGDTAVFASVSGIGGKTASRIVLELRGKLELAGIAGAQDDPVFQALIKLGYSAKQAADAMKAIKNLPADLSDLSNMSNEAKVKAALKELSK